MDDNLFDDPELSSHAAMPARHRFAISQLRKSCLHDVVFNLFDARHDPPDVAEAIANPTGAETLT